ncbi:NAD-dependent malic enzyme 62 kDa isoform [Hibiscus syriacus]|uniref:NAD-dependent malic enzyme 62 kDa isoform n=1 Tax=Hibiscus syriacus TaxID=106335 RepID=A0A6A2YBG3_HIBSY|nr:NAD-dependent malic enzyme 62 kDa isoform [Hibiscus syriacus]
MSKNIKYLQSSVQIFERRRARIHQIGKFDRFTSPRAAAAGEKGEHRWTRNGTRNTMVREGTAGVAIAGLLGAVRAQKRPMIVFPKQKIVVARAGSAGIGVVNAARKTMARMLGNTETAFDSAMSQFWVVDANGLITEERENIDPDALPFARRINEAGRQGLREGASLAEVVRQVQPDVPLGLSGVGGLFSKEVLEALKGSISTKPAISAMSNPTKNAECTPEEAFKIVGDNIIFASGSPFRDVDLALGSELFCLALGSYLMACYRLQQNGQIMSLLRDKDCDSDCNSIHSDPLQFILLKN